MENQLTCERQRPKEMMNRNERMERRKTEGWGESCCEYKCKRGKKNGLKIEQNTDERGKMKEVMNRNKRK